MAPALRITADLDAYRRSPVGRALVGSCWVAWCLRRELFGFSLWGRPGAAETDQLVAALRVELDPRIGPHQSLVDARRVEGVDVGAFEALGAYLSEHEAAFAGRVTRLALLRPGGLAGAVVAGFFEVLRAPYPVGVFDDPAEAVAFLRIETAWFAAVDEVVIRATGIDPFVARLRAFIQEGLPQVAMASAARALVVSERTLQRRLQQAGTTFVREVAGVRLVEAQRRMADWTNPLTTVALQVGFSSLQHMSAQFKAATGVTPSEWRRNRR